MKKSELILFFFTCIISSRMFAQVGVDKAINLNLKKGISLWSEKKSK